MVQAQQQHGHAGDELDRTPLRRQDIRRGVGIMSCGRIKVSSSAGHAGKIRGMCDVQECVSTLWAGRTDGVGACDVTVLCQAGMQ